jgi:hypothetical protein
MVFFNGDRIQWDMELLHGDDKMFGVIERCWKGSPEETKSGFYGLAKFLVRLKVSMRDNLRGCMTPQ